MSVPEHVLVVGAGLAGLRTVENLRRDGYEGRISLVGAEEHLPYDRPPLSKQFLAGEWERTKVDLCTAEDLDELGVRTHLGRSAVALRPAEDPADGSEIELDDGTVLHADAVVLAVGVTSRVLDDQPDSAHLLRAVDESEQLRDALASASSLLVVGAGFIGAEVASTARDRGVTVTVVETGSVPMARLLGEQAGAVVARLMGDQRPAFDTYRRFLQKYAEVVMGVDASVFEDILMEHKRRAGWRRLTVWVSSSARRTEASCTRCDWAWRNWQLTTTCIGSRPSMRTAITSPTSW